MFVLELIDKFPLKAVLNIGYRYDSDKTIENFCKDKGISFTSLEVFNENCEELIRKGADVIEMDCRNIASLDKKFDAVLWLHGPEHISWNDFLLLRYSIESKSKYFTLYQTPLGPYFQGAIYGNPFEIHRTALFPKMFAKLGYTVKMHEEDPVPTFSAYVSNYEKMSKIGKVKGAIYSYLPTIFLINSIKLKRKILKRISQQIIPWKICAYGKDFRRGCKSKGIIVKYRRFKDEECLYDHKIKTSCEEDSCKLDYAKTTGMVFFGKKYMKYPKFHRQESFRLPFNEFRLERHRDKKIFISPFTNGYYEESDRVFIHSDTKSGEACYFRKLLPVLNFTGIVWSHFIQDNLPILIFARDILIQDESIDLLMYRPEHDTFEEIMKRLQIKNRVHFIDYSSKYYINVKELYFFSCNSYMPTYWWNNWFYKEINKLITSKNKEDKKNLILNKRTKDRQIFNHDQLSDFLRSYASKNDLNFIEFYHEDFSPSDRFSLFENAKIVIAPHGAANYHVIFCDEGTKFIEICFCDCMYTLYNIASSLNLDYYIIPSHGDNSSQGCYVDIKKIENILGASRR